MLTSIAPRQSSSMKANPTVQYTLLVLMRNPVPTRLAPTHVNIKLTGSRQRRISPCFTSCSGGVEEHSHVVAGLSQQAAARVAASTTIAKTLVPKLHFSTLRHDVIDVFV